MPMLPKAIAAVLPLLSGCVVAAHDPPRHYHSPPPPAETTVVVDVEADDVHYVVYREYFGCTDAEIAVFPHYRHYYGLTDDDIYFIYYTSLLCGVTFDVCFRSYYYECGRSYDRLVVYYRVPRERYFVSIGSGFAPPTIYARTYSAHRAGTLASVTFSNQEYVALVHMKVGCEYQGHAPGAYFDRVKATGSSGRVIVESRDHCGRGGQMATGKSVATTAPRPWTMSSGQKARWRRERQASATRSEATFREKHREQAAKVEKQPPAPHRSEPPKPVERQDQGPSEKPPPKRREPPPERPKGGEKPGRGGPKDK
jgi:hypothetical protein